jgi:hypothetical protein
VTSLPDVLLEQASQAYSSASLSTKHRTLSEQTALRSDNAATTFGGAAVDGPSREVFTHVVAASVHGR